jgi:hypothetical protein
MDREADSFELLSGLVEQGQRLIIRVRAETRRTADGGHVGAAAQGLSVLAEREIWVGAAKARYSNGKSKKAPRRARTNRVAKLQVRACTVQLPPPERMSGSVTMNLVHVTEIDAPEGQDPVDWKLYTTDPVATKEQVLLVVDRYRSRWVIEEYFKAIKTGCAYEKRQLGSRRALMNALAAFIPIAWTLLVLRQECRGPEGARSTALSHQQMQILRAVLRKPLPEDPSPRDVLLAVAALGGHVKNNGDPGWQVLGRGLERLLTYQVGWCAATKDQS